MATIAQAAAHIFCSRSQFDQYIAEGAITRQSSGKYDLDEVRRETFAHLRSVAAGRGGAAGDRLTAERVALTAAKRRREERQDAIEAGQVAQVEPIVHFLQGTHPTSAVLSDAWYFAKRVTLNLALRSSGDAGRGFGRVGAAAALVAG